MGVGATERLSAVRWGVAGQVVMAWIFTWPSCILLGFFLEKLFANIYPPLVLATVVVLSVGFLRLAWSRSRRERADSAVLASA
jgi:hypothetical protein